MLVEEHGIETVGQLRKALRGVSGKTRLKSVVSVFTETKPVRFASTVEVVPNTKQRVEQEIRKVHDRHVSELRAVHAEKGQALAMLEQARKEIEGYRRELQLIPTLQNALGHATEDAEALEEDILHLVRLLRMGG